MLSLLGNVDWVTELRLSCNDVDLSPELFPKSEKINKFLGTSPKSIKQTKKAIKQTMTT